MKFLRNLGIALILIIFSPILLPLGFVVVIGCTIGGGVALGLESIPSAFGKKDDNTAFSIKNVFGLKDYVKIITPVLLSFLPMIFYSPNKTYMDAKIIENKQFNSYFEIALYNNTVRELGIDNTNSIKITFNENPDTIILDKAIYTTIAEKKNGKKFFSIIIQDMKIDKFGKKYLKFGFNKQGVILEDITSKDAHIGQKSLTKSSRISFILYILLTSIIIGYIGYYLIHVIRKVALIKSWVKENEVQIDNPEFKYNLLHKDSQYIINNHYDDILKHKPKELLNYSYFNTIISIFYMLFFLAISVLELFSLFTVFPNENLNNITLYSCILITSSMFLIILVRNIIHINSYNFWLSSNENHFRHYLSILEKKQYFSTLQHMEYFLSNGEIYEAILVSPKLFKSMKIIVTPFRLSYHRFIMVLMIVLIILKIIALALVI